MGGQKSGNISGATGVWDCGPNVATLGLVVYDGLQGFAGRRDAPVVDMYGDWMPTGRETVPAPTVTSVPTETPKSRGGNSSQERGGGTWRGGEGSDGGRGGKEKPPRMREEMLF